MEIRSFRSVFDLERRIYRIDQLRLNPGGIPVRGVVYLLALLAAAVLAARLPLSSAVAGRLPWYLGYLALPAGAAALLTVIRVEGRPFHLAGHALLRSRAGPRRLAGMRPCSPGWCAPPRGIWRPPEIVFLPDGSDGRMRRLRYTGPGAVLVAVAHERAMCARGRNAPMRRRPCLTLRELPDGPALAHGEVIVLEGSARLRVR